MVNCQAYRKRRFRIAVGFEKLTDEQWKMVREAMMWQPFSERGRSRADLRTVWNSILYVLSRRYRWSDLPKQHEIYAARSTAHRWLSIWSYQRVFDRVLSKLLQIALDNNLVDLTQISVDESFSPCSWRRRQRCLRI